MDYLWRAAAAVLSASVLAACATPEVMAGSATCSNWDLWDASNEADLRAVADPLAEPLTALDHATVTVAEDGSVRIVFAFDHQQNLIDAVETWERATQQDYETYGWWNPGDYVGGLFIIGASLSDDQDITYHFNMMWSGPTRLRDDDLIGSRGTAELVLNGTRIPAGTSRWDVAVSRMDSSSEPLEDPQLVQVASVTAESSPGLLALEFPAGTLSPGFASSKWDPHASVMPSASRLPTGPPRLTGGRFATCREGSRAFPSSGESQAGTDQSVASPETDSAADDNPASPPDFSVEEQPAYGAAPDESSAPPDAAEALQPTDAPESPPDADASQSHTENSGDIDGVIAVERFLDDWQAGIASETHSHLGDELVLLDRQAQPARAIEVLCDEERYEYQLVCFATLEGGEFLELRTTGGGSAGDAVTSVVVISR